MKDRRVDVEVRGKPPAAFSRSHNVIDSSAAPQALGGSRSDSSPQELFDPLFDISVRSRKKVPAGLKKLGQEIFPGFRRTPLTWGGAAQQACRAGMEIIINTPLSSHLRIHNSHAEPRQEGREKLLDAAFGYGTLAPVRFPLLIVSTSHG